MMEKGNVLVLGNAGVDKTTLMNAVLGQDLGEMGFGGKRPTTELKVDETNALHFRLIDSVGFEPPSFKRHQAVESVRK
jgi:predicted GTPase